MEYYAIIKNHPKMEKQFSEEELEQLAEQLSCPSGEHGITIANEMNKNNISMTLSTIQAMGLSSGQTILELGHGNAGHLEMLLSEAPNLRYSGLDISELMNQEATRINGTYIEKEQASFYLYDGTNIAFNADSFDRIFTVNTLYFWEQPLALLNELHRVLKKGGQCYITFAQKEFLLSLPFTKYKFEAYDNKRITDLVAGTGFEIVSIIDKTEKVKSKIGKEVTRDYTILTLQK